MIVFVPPSLSLAQDWQGQSARPNQTLYDAFKHIGSAPAIQVSLLAYAWRDWT
jgi:hypothetical protein